MTQTPYELLARFGSNGSVSGVSVRYLFNLNGKVIEGDPEPLSGISDPVFTSFAQQFAAAAVAERDRLASDKQQLQGQLSTMQAEKEAAETNLENLTQQLTEATSQIEALQAELAAAQARITELLEQLPFSPRVMEASAFVARIQPGELLLLLKSTDQQVQAIGAMLNEWVENDWPIILDSPEMQQAIGYLAQIGLVTQDRAAELLRDCSKAEAYVADQSGQGGLMLQMSPEVSNGQ